MSCENKIPYYVAKGYGTKLVYVSCGTTDPHGDRALCETCEADPVKRAEHEHIEANSRADNEALRSAGWGEI